MKEELVDFITANLGPFLFLIVAGALCLLLPVEKRAEAIYLVIGAALTRVKRVNGVKKEFPAVKGAICTKNQI